MFPFSLIAQEDTTVTEHKDRLVNKEVHPCLAMFINIADNPAYAGFEQRQTFRAGFTYEKPFWDAGSAYHPFSSFVTWDAGFGKKRNLGFGVFYTNNIGAYTAEHWAGLALNWRVKFGKYNNLRFGVSAGYKRRTLNWNALIFPDQIAGCHGIVFNTNEMQPIAATAGDPDFSAGIVYSRKNLYISFSGQNLLRSERGLISADWSPRWFILGGGYVFRLSSRASLATSANVFFLRKQLTATPRINLLLWDHLLVGMSLDYLNTGTIHLGCRFFNKLTFFASCGMAVNAQQYYHLGPLDHITGNLNVEFGRFEK